MNRRVLQLSVCLFAPCVVLAQLDRASLERYDIRDHFDRSAARRAALSTAPRKAVARDYVRSAFDSRAGRVSISFNRHKRVRLLKNTGGTLGRVNSSEPVAGAREFLGLHQALFPVAGNAAVELAIISEQRFGPMTKVIFEQRIEDLPVWSGTVSVVLIPAASGGQEVVQVEVRDVVSASGFSAGPTLSAGEAVAAAL